MRRFALALALAPACGREPDTGLSTGPGVTSVSVSSSSTGASSSSSTTTGAEGSSGSVAGGSSGTMLDMGLMPDFESGQPQGCKGKIDFLFLIARNGTMKTEQAQLRGPSRCGRADALSRCQQGLTPPGAQRWARWGRPAGRPGWPARWPPG